MSLANKYLYFIDFCFSLKYVISLSINRSGDKFVERIFGYSLC